MKLAAALGLIMTLGSVSVYRSWTGALITYQAFVQGEARPCYKQTEIDRSYGHPKLPMPIHTIRIGKACLQRGNPMKSLREGEMEMTKQGEMSTIEFLLVMAAIVIEGSVLLMGIGAAVAAVASLGRF